MGLTTDPNDPCLQAGQKDQGQNECYLVLSEEERAKGFVRPVRDKYIHKGRYYGDGIRLLETPEVHGSNTYVAIARIVLSGGVESGAYITQKELDQYNATGGYIGGCGTETVMGTAIAETYARNPSFYGSTYCVHCGVHKPVGEFVWKGTDDNVGS